MANKTYNIQDKDKQGQKPLINSYIEKIQSFSFFPEDTQPPGLFFMESKCLFKASLLENPRLQLLQINGLSFECIYSWRLRSC
jgi:hypothetical protein